MFRLWLSLLVSFLTASKRNSSRINVRIARAGVPKEAEWNAECTSVSSPLSNCSRIISVYVLEPISGVLPPVIKNQTSRKAQPLDNRSKNAQIFRNF